MRVVEFVGPPGAGKSRIIEGTIRDTGGGSIYEPQAATLRWARMASPSRALRAALRVLPDDLARKATNRLLARGFFIDGAIERFRDRYPDYLDATFDLIARRRDALPEAELFRGWVSSLAARYQLASEALDPAAVLLLEEGFGTRGVGLFAFGWDPAAEPDLARYARVMPPPDVVVFVDTSVEVCRQRLEARRWTRRSRALSDAERAAYLAGGRDVARFIADQMAARGAEVARVRSETAEDVEPAVRATLKALDRAKTKDPTR